MNDTLVTLANAYLNDGTGSIMLYYDFAETGSVGFETGIGADYSITLTTSTATFNNNQVDNSSLEAINLYSGNSLIGTYTLDTPGATNQDIEDGLDPSNNYNISIDTIQSGQNITIRTDQTGVISGSITEFDGLNDVFFFGDIFEASTLYSGYIKNVSPSSTVGDHNAFFVDSDFTEGDKDTLTGSIITNDLSGADLTLTSLKFNDFSGEGFLSPDDFDTNVTFLFSFEKIKNDHGIIFGCLNRFDYSGDASQFHYGKGFNIGINDRNKLFFQGIDSEIGEYVLVANELELANKNLCSAVVSPYSVRFSLYDLADDEFYEQSLRTDSKIQNNDWGNSLYIGRSNEYLVTGSSFSGFMNEFMIVSGDYTSSDLKSLASGFVATGIINSGSSFTSEIVTGHEISLITPVGVTGYQLVPTGYQEVVSESSFIEFVLVENPTPFSRNDGERFLTGYTLPNNSGSYLEETSFLIPQSDYLPTGDDAFATLGLVDSGDVVTRYTVETTKIVEIVSGVALYEISPITGILLEEPTGYEKTNLTESISKTGSLAESLSFKSGYAEPYKLNYIYYLDQRI